MAALAALKKEGKIRAIGVSNFSLAQLKEANKNGEVDLVEDNYSLVQRTAEKELFPYLKEQQISFVPYYPLASGLLTGGKYQATDRDKFERFTPAQFRQIIAALVQVKELAQKHAATVAQVILAWYLQNPALSVVIPGARKPEQVQNNVGALNVELTPAEYTQIDKLFREF